MCNSRNTPTTNVYNSATNRDGRLTYDSAGNLTTVNGNTATYNAENQLSSLTATNGATETLYYDALGNRVKKVTGYVLDSGGH
jgi:YD repeat-containing protein